VPLAVVLYIVLFQDKKDKDHHHHHHHHRRHHKKSTSDDVAGPSSDLLVPTGSIESPNADQYSMLLQTSASASDISSAANGPAAVNILCIQDEIKLLLTVQRTSLASSDKVFSVNAPAVWNSLSFNCRSCKLFTVLLSVC